MYKIFLNQADTKNELLELIRMFLPPSAYELLPEDPWNDSALFVPGDLVIRVPDSIRNKNDGKRYLYDALTHHTGKRPEWGILTGVRPVKLTGELIHKTGSKHAAEEMLRSDYRISEEKAKMLLDTWETQQQVIVNEKDTAVGLYIGIPFCPTRCVYCSFPSYQVGEDQMRSYLNALFKEIDFVGRNLRERGITVESLYIGGGTPTSLSAELLKRLLYQIETAIDCPAVREYTVEAGRPDTITEEKLQIIRDYGAKRISINPQSMKEETLSIIGRMHSPKQIREAYEMARVAGFSVINMDLIAGLPKETADDFTATMEEILSMKPENITVHTLAVKRASKLRQESAEYAYHEGQVVRRMLQTGAALLQKDGYRPYYLYRQKQMTGNFENVGYAKPGTESIYNIRIMEENQSIIALGAGGISKILFPGNRLERVPNVSNYEIYIEKIEEMLERKRKGIFS